MAHVPHTLAYLAGMRVCIDWRQNLGTGIGLEPLSRGPLCSGMKEDVGEQ